MKKILMILGIVALVGCTSCNTMQPIEKSIQISEGMSKDEVLKIMGSPVRNEFSKHIDEWHYCKSGFSTHQYLTVYFYEGKVIALKSYTVTKADVDNTTFDSCENFIKRGTYKDPDVVIEIRNRY